MVLAYGRILPPDVLSGPRLGCLNLHASLLPRYRGAAPIAWAVFRGETETGISLMQMDAGLDTGPVFSQHTTPIGPDETAGDLATRLGLLAADVVRKDIPKVARGELIATPQDNALATLAPILRKEDGRIHWAQAADKVHAHVRAMSPWPGAHTRAVERVLKVLATRTSTFSPGAAPPGTVVSADRSGVLVACEGGCIEIARAQLEGRKPLTGPELAMGRALSAGMTLG
jgi:methionyl-tRNA formyltransferase